MNPEAVKRWVSKAYAVPFEHIDHVCFDVQEGTRSEDGPGVQLEIDVRMTDGSQYLFVRRGYEFGTIVSQFDDASC